MGIVERALASLAEAVALLTRRIDPVEVRDVERAARRVALLARATGAPVVPVAAGEQILGEAEREAQAMHLDPRPQS